MSPEQAEINQLDIDTRSDIYSLGVLLYELLAGSPPFSRKELEKAGMLEMLRVIREQEPSKPSTKLSTAEGLPTLAANRGTEPAKLTKLVRGELDWIVMKALEKDRNRRYETANGFAMDVQRYLADEPVQACPPSAGYRLRKFARRNRRALVTASVVALAVVLTAAAMAVSTVLICAGESGPAPGPRPRAGRLDRERRNSYVAHRPGGAGMGGEQPRPDGSAARAVPGRLARLGMALPQAAAVPRASARCAMRAPSTASRSAPTASTWPRPRRTALSDSGRQRPARNSGNGGLTRSNATSVAFSPDGRYLASGGWDGKVKVWDVQTVLQGEVQRPSFAWTHQPSPGVECHLQPGRSAPGLRRRYGKQMRKGK